jgi:hypothetical protein
MKKYFFGLIAAVAAITFCSFNSPMGTNTFLLSSDPTTAYIVSTPSNWTTSGNVFGDCSATPEQLACTIKLQTSTMSAFYHNNGFADVLNTDSYALAQGVGARYLEVNESNINPRYTISIIFARKIVLAADSVSLISAPDNSKNISKQQNLSAGVDVAYFNAKFQ